MRLILVRHGETDSNKASLALGRDDVELNETGRWARQRGGRAPADPRPGGERLVDVQERAWQALDRICGSWSQETVAVVTHNFVLLTILCRVLGLELADFRRLRHNGAPVSVLQGT